MVTDAAIVGDSVQSVLSRPTRPGHAPGPAPPPHPGAGRGPDRPRPPDLPERQQQLGGVPPRGGRQTELPCEAGVGLRNSEYCTVLCRVYSRAHCTVQISWFRRTGPNSVLVLLTVADDTYVADTRISIVRPVLSMVSSVGLN